MEPKAGSQGHTRPETDHLSCLGSEAGWDSEVVWDSLPVLSQPSYTSISTPPICSIQYLFKKHWATSFTHHASSQALAIQRLTRYYICSPRGGKYVNRKWQFKETCVMVEGNPGVMMVQSREARGCERAHFLTLVLSEPWRTLTHCETLNCICHLAMAFILHTAKHLGLMVSPEFIPQHLPLDNSVLMLLGTMPVPILPSMSLKRAEASSDV